MSRRLAPARHEDVEGEAADQLLRYAWPGNVRELENTMERAVALARGSRVVLEDLPDEVRHTLAVPTANGAVRPLRDIEKDYIIAALALSDGNQTRTRLTTTDGAGRTPRGPRLALSTGMTNLISTTKSSATKLDTALEPPTASELLVDGPKATLESHINTRRAELNQKLTELSASMHLDAIAAREKIKARLSELSHIIKQGIVDGWANVGDPAKRKLDSWLADSAKELTFEAKSGQSW